jgi:copper chaperone NosL
MKKSLNTHMSLTMKIATVACAAIMLFVLSVPIWKIELTAPQYPEGLVLKIWANKLGGNVDVINGLNHYIGMKHLDQNSFIEFKVLPYIIIGYSLLGLITLLINRRKVFAAWFYLFILIAVVAMVDFYNWEYQYGHNLDPTAPIQVPGMAYQPPLIGFKQLLNFTAYSIPDTGGWLFILVGVLLGATWFFNWRTAAINLKTTRLHHKPVAAITAVVLLFLNSCQREPQAINYGGDNCDFCKMTIIDSKFASQIVTKKGKVYKFDDAHCIKSFLKNGTVSNDDIFGVYFSDFSGSNKWINAEQCAFLKSEQLHSPMGGNIAAFGTKTELLNAKKQLEGEELSWKDITS